MRSIRQGALLAALLLVVTMVFTGCSDTSAQGQTSQSPPVEGAAQAIEDSGEQPQDTLDTSQTVEINMVLIGTPSPDYEQALEALNQKLLEKCSATLSLIMVPWEAMATYYPQIIASKAYDIIAIDTQWGYADLAQAGNFLDIEALLAGDSELNGSIAAQLTQQAKAQTEDGKLYCIPAASMQLGGLGLAYREDILSQSIEVKDVVSLGKLLTAFANKEEGLAPMLMGEGGAQQLFYAVTGLVQSPLVEGPIAYDTKSKQFVNIFAHTQAQAYFTSLQKWIADSVVQKGEAAPTDLVFGNTGVMVVSANQAAQIGDRIMLNDMGWTVGFRSSSSMTAAAAYLDGFAQGVAIRADSAYPQRCLDVIAKLQLDKECADLLQMGVLGVDYVQMGDEFDVAEGKVLFNMGGSYLRNEKTYLGKVGGWRVGEKLLNIEKEDGALGDNPLAKLTFDKSSWKGTIAALEAVSAQYAQQLYDGTAEKVEQTLKDMNDKYAEAGIQEYIEAANQALK